MTTGINIGPAMYLLQPRLKKVQHKRTDSARASPLGQLLYRSETAPSCSRQLVQSTLVSCMSGGNAYNTSSGWLSLGWCSIAAGCGPPGKALQLSTYLCVVEDAADVYVKRDLRLEKIGSGSCALHRDSRVLIWTVLG